MSEEITIANEMRRLLVREPIEGGAKDCAQYNVTIQARWHRLTALEYFSRQHLAPVAEVIARALNTEQPFQVIVSPYLAGYRIDVIHDALIFAALERHLWREVNHIPLKEGDVVMLSQGIMARVTGTS